MKKFDSCSFFYADILQLILRERENMKKERIIALLCALTATLCWASNYLVYRLMFKCGGVPELDEWWSSWLRTLLCVVFMLPFTFTDKEKSWGLFASQWKKDWKLFLFLGFALVAEGALCFAAAKYTTAARTSLFANTSPVFTLLISFIFAREVFSRRKLIGVFMGLAGIIIAAVSRGSDAFSSGISTLAGDVLALLSGVFWASFTVFGGSVSGRYNGAFCTVLYRLCGLLLMAPVLFFCDVEFALPWKVWLGFLYVAGISGGVAVWLWSIAQKYLEPGVLGSFGYLSAFSATLFSIVFLGEKLTFAFAAAFILIIGGMALVIRKSA